MPKQQPQPIPIMQPRGGRGGGGSASLQVAVGNFVNDQSKAQKKLMDNFGKLSEAQAMEASQNAAQMTGAMNQIVAREDERQAREESYQEKKGDRAYQEKYHEWTAGFQKQAAKDLMVTQERVNSQTAAVRDFITRTQDDRIKQGSKIDAMTSLLYNPKNVEYWSRTPGGMERVEKMGRLLEVAKYQHSLDPHSELSGQAAQMLSTVREQILGAEPHADLTQLYGEAPSKLAEELGEDWTEEETRELFHTGGYVPGGLYGRDPNDPALKKYKGTNPTNYLAVMWTLEDLQNEQAFAYMKHSKYKDKSQIARMKQMRDLGESMKPMEEFDNQDYQRLEKGAPEGAYYGLARFAEELGSGRLPLQSISQSLMLKSGYFAEHDPAQQLGTRALEAMFTSIAGPNSEAMLQKLDKVLDGTTPEGVLDTREELYMALALRNRLRHVSNQALGMEKLPSVRGGETLLMDLAGDIVDGPRTPERDQLVKTLVMVPGDVQAGELLEGVKTQRFWGWLEGGEYAPAVVGQVHRGLLRVLGETAQQAKDLTSRIDKSPAVRGYQLQQGGQRQYVDSLVMSWMSRHGEDIDPTNEAGMAAARQQALRSATTKERITAMESVEGELPEDFDIERETAMAAAELTTFQALGELSGAFVSDPESIAALFSGNLDFRPLPRPGPNAPTAEWEAALEQLTQRGLEQDRLIQDNKRRQREEYAKKNAQSGEAEQAQPQTGDEPNAPMMGPKG